MKTLIYTKIKDINQYVEYCNLHERLFEKLIASNKDESLNDEIQLLEILINEFDNRIEPLGKKNVHPVSLLKNILKNSGISQSTLAQELSVSRQLISDILTLRRHLSREMIKKLSKHFGMSELAFSKEYSLIKNVEKKNLTKKPTTKVFYKSGTTVSYVREGRQRKITKRKK